MDEDPGRVMQESLRSRERTTDMSGRPETTGVLTPPPQPPIQVVMEACHPDSLSRDSPLLGYIADKEGLPRVRTCTMKRESHTSTEDKSRGGSRFCALD